VGVVQGALAERLVEDGGRGVSCRFCLGEHGGECVPGGVVEDALGVFRYRLLEVMGEAALGLEAGGAACEVRQDRAGDLRIRGLQVDKGLLGRRLLLGVLAGAVPVHRERHRGEHCVQEHRESGPVTVLGPLPPDRLDAAAQDATAVQVRGDAGAGGALEDGSGLFEFGLEGGRCGDRQEVQCGAERDHCP